MLALRTYAGVDLDHARNRYDLEMEATQPHVIDRLAARGLLVVQDRHLRPTLEDLLADYMAHSF